MAKQVNTGDEKQVRKRQNLADLAREREIEEMRQVLSTVGGRAVIYRILMEGDPEGNPVTHELESFRQMGRQDVGRYILKEVFTSNPEASTVMRLEAEERAKG